MKAPFGLIAETGCISVAPDRTLGLRKSCGTTGRDQISLNILFKLETNNIVVIYGNNFCLCNMTWNVVFKVLYILSVTDVFPLYMYWPGRFKVFFKMCFYSLWILNYTTFQCQPVFYCLFSSNLHCTSVNFHIKINVSVSFTHFSAILLLLLSD